MPISFLPNSDFGTYALRQLLESRGTYVAVQLLNVPPEAPGDRTTWTWTANWSQYAIAGAFSGTGGNLNLSSQGASPPVTITAYEEATSAFPGAFYDTNNAYPGNGYVYIYNNSINTYTYSHVAIFVMQPNVATLTALQFTDASLLEVSYIYDFETEEQTTSTLPPNYAKLFSFSLPNFNGGASVTVAEGWDGWQAYDANYTENFGSFTAPYPLPYDPSYKANKQSSPPLLPNFKAVLGVSDQDTTTSFFAELLNVTSTEPNFEDGWSSWETYRINRYSTASLIPAYNYAEKDSYYELEFDGTTIAFSIAGTEVACSNYTEFIFTPPTAGSFTFTHIAVFVNEIDVPPQQDSSYTYPDTTKFVGVIKLPSAVTMTTSSEQRAYPFRFAFMGPMSYDIAIVP